MTGPADTIREGLDPTGYTEKALAALTELEQQLAAAQDLAAAMQDSANRGWEHHAAAERDRDRLADTLREIAANPLQTAARDLARAALDRQEAKDG